MELRDILGAGQITEKLLGAIENATGALYRPLGVRLLAGADAERLRRVGTAEADVNAYNIRTLAQAEADGKLILDAADAELAERAATRERTRKIQQQRNLDVILTQALVLTSADGSGGTPNGSAEEPAEGDQVDPDWLSHFIDLAEGVNARAMQALWARVLAREVVAPGQFSIRSLETLKRLTRDEAAALEAASRLVALEHGAIVTGYTEDVANPSFSLRRFLRARVTTSWSWMSSV